MDEISRQVTVQLGQPATVINAPPSQKTEYPAMAILIDEANFDISNDDEDVQIDSTKQPGDDGYELTGYWRTDPTTNVYVTGEIYHLDQDTTISQVGTVRMKARLWVGARLDPQREQIEEEIAIAFYADRSAPGRMMVSAVGVEIRGIKIPFGVATAMLEDKIQWNSEFAFAERLWSYLPLTIDVPLLIPRTDPLAAKLMLMISEDLATTVATPDDLTNLSDLQQFSIDTDGNATLIP